MTGATRRDCLPRSLRAIPAADQKIERRAAELLLSRCAKSQNSQAARSGPVGPASDSRCLCVRLLNTRAHASRSAVRCVCVGPATVSVPSSLTEHLGGL